MDPRFHGGDKSAKNSEQAPLAHRLCGLGRPGWRCGSRRHGGLGRLLAGKLQLPGLGQRRNRLLSAVLASPSLQPLCHLERGPERKPHSASYEQR